MVHDSPMNAAKLRTLAFALLAKREYSCADLTTKLLNYTTDLEEVTRLVEELAINQYVSDERMAGMLVRSQLRQNKGLMRIQQQLKKHQIDIELAETELAKVNWFEQALALKIKKFGTAISQDPKEKAKQIRFLQYRGFSLAVIFKVIGYQEDE